MPIAIPADEKHRVNIGRTSRQIIKLVDRKHGDKYIRTLESLYVEDLDMVRQIAEEILADGRLSWEEVLQIVLAVRGGSSVIALAPEMGIPPGTRAVIRAKPRQVPA